MKVEIIKNMNLIENLQKLETFKISWVPADKPIDEAKYFILKSINPDENQNLIIQNNCSSLNREFYNFTFEDGLQIGPLPIVNLSKFELNHKSDELIIKNLIRSNNIVQYDIGYNVYDDETRPAPRKLSNKNPNQTHQKEAFTEDEIQEFYICILRYIHSFNQSKKPNKILNLSSSLDLNSLNKLKDILKSIVINEAIVNKITKNEITDTINTLGNFSTSQNIDKFNRFTSQMLNQLQRLIEVGNTIQDLNKYLLLADQIKMDFGILFNFWFNNVFQDGLKSYPDQSYVEFNFFQSQNINIQEVVENSVKRHEELPHRFYKLYIKHLETFKILPIHTSLLRIISDAIKTYSLEELSSRNFSFKEKIQRFYLLYNVVRSFDFVDLQKLEYAKKTVLLDTYCDIIIDANSEIPNNNLFQSINNGQHNYISATACCLKTIENILFKSS